MSRPKTFFCIVHRELPPYTPRTRYCKACYYGRYNKNGSRASRAARAIADRAKLAPGWYLFCEGVPYIPLRYATRAEAETVLEDLLLPYPPRSFWRRAITVEVIHQSPGSQRIGS